MQIRCYLKDRKANMTLYNDAEREKLINELKEYAYASNNTMISVYKVCDFILADRKRICDPLVKAETHILRFQTQELGANMLRKKAIDQTLGLSGLRG